MLLRISRLHRAIVFSIASLILVSAALVAANSYNKPKSILHVVTLYWKESATEAQKQQVFAGIEKMASEVPGLKNIWLKSIKVQGDIGGHPVESVFVMEFADEAAFKAYDNHPAHRAWEKIYTPLRGESRTHDITN